MSIKVLVTSTNQHVIADIKQIENSDTKQVLGFVLKDAKVVIYVQAKDDSGTLNIRLVDFCAVATEDEFTVREDFVKVLLEPRPEVVEAYNNIVNPAPAQVELTTDEPSTDTPEDGTDTDK